MAKRANVVISSVYVREKSFVEFRSIAKKCIDSFRILQGLRSPEDLATQELFQAAMREKCLALVLILGKERSSAVREEFLLALHLGIPVIAMVQSDLGSDGRAVEPEGAREILKEAPYIYDYRRVVFRGPDDLDSLLEVQLEEIIYKKLLGGGHLTTHPPGVYREGLQILRWCVQHVTLCQRTSSLLLGPRMRRHDERQFYEELYSWIQKCARLDHLHFLHLFSLDETLAEARMSAKDYQFDGPSGAWSRLETILDCVEEAPTRIHLRFTDEPFTPMLLGDNGFGVPVSLGANRWYLLVPGLHMEPGVAEKARDAVETMGADFTRQEFNRFKETLFKV